MGLSIKNDVVETMARDLAERRGVSITEAIRQSLEHEIAREPKSEAEVAAEIASMIEISDRAAALMVTSEMTDDEILGYDEFGAPTL